MKNIAIIALVGWIFVMALSGCAPSEPAPSEPAPSEPALSEPAPSEPALSEPALSEPAPVGQGEQALSSQPLTFWYSGNGAELRPALECALKRIRAATCLPVDVSLDGAHRVSQRPPEEMPAGRIGSTHGTWNAARIYLKTPMGPQSNCRVLVHEIAQHVLRRKNTHVGASLHMDEALLTEICAVQDCGCFNPETSDNPIPSDQTVCQ